MRKRKIVRENFCEVAAGASAEADGGARAYDFVQSHHALRACVSRDSVQKKLEFQPKGTTKIKQRLIGLFYFCCVSKIFRANNDSNEKINNVKQENKIIDTNNDGLTNQEEVYYGTDIKNPDSDNDGYADGEEVKKGFNPSGERKLNIQQNHIVSYGHYDTLWEFYLENKTWGFRYNNQDNEKKSHNFIIINGGKYGEYWSIYNLKISDNNWGFKSKYSPDCPKTSLRIEKRQSDFVRNNFRISTAA